MLDCELSMPATMTIMNSTAPASSVKGTMEKASKYPNRTIGKIFMHLEEMIAQHAIGSVSHRLMDLVVTANGYEITCLVDSGTTHYFICANLLETASLQPSLDEPLEVVLANREKVETNQVFKIPINFGQGFAKSINGKLLKR